jgi:uncharacterized protein YdaL
MVRSQTKIRHIQESNRLLENRMLYGRRLMEYDIDNESMEASLEQELNSVSSEIKEYMPNIDLSSADAATETLSNSEVCTIGEDMDGFVKKKFGQKILELFPDKAQEVMRQVADSLNSFIDFISTLKLSDLKSFLKTLKSKIEEVKNSKEETTTVSEGTLIREFFGTSMALVTLFSGFTMPALILTIGAYIIVGLLALWLIKALLCSFNIDIKSIKRCRVRQFSWGQCK